MKVLRTSHGEIRLPAFLPDATRGVVRGVDARDLLQVGVQGLVVNAYHLMLRPGARLVQSLGGIHRFMDWRRPILVDSGGYQVFSLIRRRPGAGAIREDGVIFRSPYDGEKTILTPRKSIEAQFHLGADIMVCLDDCTSDLAGGEEQHRAVERTVRWARQCRQTFDELTRSGLPPTSRGTGEGRSDQPVQRMLFAVVQGGADLDLRRRCAEALVEMDFDGYGFGGWPVDERGALLTEVLAFLAEILPPDKPRYAMGLGRPENVVACVRMGYDLFDCVIPTREARHHHAFRFTADSPEEIDLSRPDFYERLNLMNGRFARDGAPISEICDCPCCRSYSRAYLRHLFQVRDMLGPRLLTIHNLRFYAMLMEHLRGEDGQSRPGNHHNHPS